MSHINVILMGGLKHIVGHHKHMEWVTSLLLLLLLKRILKIIDIDMCIFKWYEIFKS